MDWGGVAAVLMLLFQVAHLDCGCDSLKRVDAGSSPADAEFQKPELHDRGKVCERNARLGNKQYRDYYPEREEEFVIEGMALIPGGEYLIGTDTPHFHDDREAPERSVKLKDFYMDKFEVSNEAFLQFVQANNYTTEAERFGDSFLFKALLTQTLQQEYHDYRVASAPWWYKVKGVSWKKPNGPNSSLEGFWNHPVVHISWNDAVAFCKWADKRLPTEAEWEVACRGGRKRKLYPWGNKLMPKDEHWLNIWQGDFPDKNTVEDGYMTTSPVNSFRQNAYDIYNIVGNVWEWTADLWQEGDASRNPNYVKKGGSYLCHESYCYRYRCASRSQNTADSSAGNLGFRCAKDL